MNPKVSRFLGLIFILMLQLQMAQNRPFSEATIFPDIITRFPLPMLLTP
jgi:hypothetical protein